MHLVYARTWYVLHLVLFNAVVSPMDKINFWPVSFGHNTHCAVSVDDLRLYWSSISLNL